MIAYGCFTAEQSKGYNNGQGRAFHCENLPTKQVICCSESDMCNKNLDPPTLPSDSGKNCEYNVLTCRIDLHKICVCNFNFFSSRFKFDVLKLR